MRAKALCSCLLLSCVRAAIDELGLFTQTLRFLGEVVWLEFNIIQREVFAMSFFLRAHRLNDSSRKTRSS